MRRGIAAAAVATTATTTTTLAPWKCMCQVQDVCSTLWPQWTTATPARWTIVTPLWVWCMTWYTAASAW